MSFLNKKIINFEPKLFGIDLSDLSVKVMQLEKDGKLDIIRSFNSVNIAPGNIEDGKIINKDKVAEIIRWTVQKSGPKKINTNKVICSLPESKAFLRMITIPKMAEEEAGEAVKWEMEANIPLPIDQVYFDWQFLGETGDKNKQSVLTLAVAKETVDDFVEVMEKAGLDVYGMEVESIASARSLLSKKGEDREIASLIVDLGAQRTSFIISIKDIPYFTSSIPFSSESIDDAIEKNLNVSLEEAEEIKINYGIEEVEGNSAVFQSVKALLENLVQEMEKTMDFYSELSTEKTPIEKIILCGGGANMKGLIPYLAKRMNKEVVTGDPWVNLNLGKKLPIINRDNSIRYSTVIGLAMRGLDYQI